MAGRISKYTPERVERIINALRAGNTRGAACHYGGIDHDTLLNWTKRYSEFSEAVSRAEGDAEVAHVANIAKASREGDWRASAWWLERRRHEDWGRKDRINIVHIIRQMAEEQGLSTQETAEALAEAERYLRELRGAGAR